MSKNIIIAGVVMLFGATSFAFSVDTAKSMVTWTGAKIVGSTHTGNVQIKEADVKWKKGEPTKGTIVIDMTTITNTDLKDAKYNKKLVGHLKSDDFFSVEKHKTATLDIKKVAKVSDKLYTLTADLNIKGKKETVTVKAEVTESTKTAKKVNATFKFDRTKFGIKYGSGKFFTDLGDKVISDEVAVAVKLHLKKEDS